MNQKTVIVEFCCDLNDGAQCQSFKSKPEGKTFLTGGYVASRMRRVSSGRYKKEAGEAPSVPEGETVRSSKGDDERNTIRIQHTVYSITVYGITVYSTTVYDITVYTIQSLSRPE